MIDKLYVCLHSDGKLSLITRREADETIRIAEESDDFELDYSVVASFPFPVLSGTIYLVTMQFGKLIFYNAVSARSEQEATNIALAKKKVNGTEIKVITVKDLTQLINSYEE